MDHYDTETMWDDEDEGEFVEEGRGRSKRKRAVQALTDLGKQLVELKPDALARFELPDELLQEIKAAQGMKHTARKRQLKFIGGLLRKMDTESIEETMANLEAQKQGIDEAFHEVERWRDRLVDEGDAAMTELMQEYPAADAGQIRQLMRNAQRERLQNKPPKSSRQLFRLLRELIAA